MAFTISGNLNGNLNPVIVHLPIGATCYAGQILGYDTAGATNGGAVIPSANAAAGPDTTSFIQGICLGVDQVHSYNSTYKGEVATYTTTQSTVAAYEYKAPINAGTMVQVALITPSTLIKAPVVKDTVGTACVEVTNTAASSGGTTVTFSAIDTTVDGYSTMYCRSGANKGVSRKVTTVGTTSSVAVVPFPYAIAVGDKFAIANVVLGSAHIAWDTQIQGIDSSAALSNYFKAYVHELNLEEAGKEYAVFALASSHLVIGTGV
jgi:hypothetical protein